MITFNLLQMMSILQVIEPKENIIGDLIIVSSSECYRVRPLPKPYPLLPANAHLPFGPRAADPVKPGLNRGPSPNFRALLA